MPRSLTLDHGKRMGAGSARLVADKRASKRGAHPRGTTITPLTAFGEKWFARAARAGVFSLYASTSFTDKTLECADCGQQFTHSAQDQQFYAERQFSEPRRCPTCRAVRKAARGDSGYSGGSYSGGGGSYSGGYGQREMFTATCDSCGGQARVPFKPTGSKPVYCSDCFSTRR
jgi:CxxC-x17-CxxC domain-containing protein